MSLLEDSIKKENAARKENNHNCAVEHMAELEAKRIANELALQSSVKANWARLKEKRTPRVLDKLLPVQLQHN